MPYSPASPWPRRPRKPGCGWGGQSGKLVYHHILLRGQRHHTQPQGKTQRSCFRSSYPTGCSCPAPLCGAFLRAGRWRQTAGNTAHIVPHLLQGDGFARQRRFGGTVCHVDRHPALRRGNPSGMRRHKSVHTAQGYPARRADGYTAIRADPYVQVAHPAARSIHIRPRPQCGAVGLAGSSAHLPT